MKEVYRIYVEKRPENAVEAKEILNDLKTELKLMQLQSVAVVNRYDRQSSWCQSRNPGSSDSDHFLRTNG